MHIALRTALFLLLLPLLDGCASEATHTAQVARLRAQRPYFTFVHGTSMEPYIRDGEFLEVRAKRFADLRPGDWAVWWPEGSESPLCHQFVRHRTSGLGETRCLNLRAGNFMGDPPQFLLTRDNYIGVAVPIGLSVTTNTVPMQTSDSIKR